MSPLCLSLAFIVLDGPAPFQQHFRPLSGRFNLKFEAVENIAGIVLVEFLSRRSGFSEQVIEGAEVSRDLQDPLGVPPGDLDGCRALLEVIAQLLHG